MASRVAILTIMIHALLLAAAPVNSEPRRRFRAAMIRRETPINFTRASWQSYERLSILAGRLDTAAAGGASTQTPLRWDGAGVYDMEVSIGTPPQKLSAVADTGSDLVWVKCGPCASCTPQGSPSYDPTKSSSFSKLPCSDHLCENLKSQRLGGCGDGAGSTDCDYQYSYGLDADPHHYTKGYMGSETFTFGSDAMKGVGFGCTTISEGNYGTGSGLVGLGRGPLSLVSQLDVGAFSYCLVMDPSKASPLLFGSLATLSGDGVQSTRLLDSKNSNTFYAVNLKSISIGSTTTPGGGTDGVVFDSGTTLTFLTDPAYTAAKAAILAQTSLTPADDTAIFDTCFQASNNDMLNAGIPKMVLHFDGADMQLPAMNHFVEVQSGVFCWVVQRSPSSVSIIGNIMQMNYHVRHDLDKKMLSFQPANCGSL